MKPLQRTALASVINLILLGMSDVQAADSQALEKRIKDRISELRTGQEQQMGGPSLPWRPSMQQY